MIGIIGCGASGMLAAIMAARGGCEVTVLEHNDKPGRKLLATGNGHCNLTNEDQSESNFRTDCLSEAQKILEQFPKQAILSFFEEIGILTHCKRGYWYPQCDQAAAVVTALEEEMKRLTVHVVYGADVTRITKGEQFTVTATVQGNVNEFSFKRLILACGGPAGDHLGQSDFGFRALRSLGIPVMRYRPALVPLELENYDGKSIAGVRMEASVRLHVYDHIIDTENSSETSSEPKILEESGEIVWTDYGISGIPVMQLSRYAAKALDSGREVTVSIRLLPENDTKTIHELVLSRSESPVFSSRNALEGLCGFVPAKLSAWIMKRAGIDPASRMCDVSKDMLLRYATELDQMTFRVKGLRPYAQAQTTCGGVPLTEIDTGTMEVRSVPGLYITGELLDVDGACGGYNLQWAFACGAVAGRAIAGTQQ